MRRFLLLICFMLCISIGQVTAECSTPFYYNPSQVNLRTYVKEMAQFLQLPACDSESIFYLNVSGIYLASAFSVDPSLIKNLEDQFSQLNLTEKAVVLRGFRAAGIANPLLINNADARLMDWVFTPPLLTLAEIKANSVATADDLDYRWAAFEASGNIEYVRPIYVFLKSVNDNDLFLGYEYVNRQWLASVMSSMQNKMVEPNFKDLNQSLRKKYKKEADYQRAMEHIGTISAAIWSIDSHVKQDAQLKQMIEKLFQDDPSLAYGKRLKKILSR